MAWLLKWISKIRAAKLACQPKSIDCYGRSECPSKLKQLLGRKARSVTPTMEHDAWIHCLLFKRDKKSDYGRWNQLYLHTRHIVHRKEQNRCFFISLSMFSNDAKNHSIVIIERPQPNQSTKSIDQGRWRMVPMSFIQSSAKRDAVSAVSLPAVPKKRKHSE